MDQSVGSADKSVSSWGLGERNFFRSDKIAGASNLGGARGVGVIGLKDLTIALFIVPGPEVPTTVASVVSKGT